MAKLKFQPGDRIVSLKPDRKTGEPVVAVVKRVHPVDHYTYLVEIGENAATKWWPRTALEKNYVKLEEPA